MVHLIGLDQCRINLAHKDLDKVLDATRDKLKEIIEECISEDELKLDILFSYEYMKD